MNDSISEAVYGPEMELVGQKVDFYRLGESGIFLDDLVLEENFCLQPYSSNGGGLYEDLCRTNDQEVKSKWLEYEDVFTAEAVVEQGLSSETEMPTLDDVLQDVCYSPTQLETDDVALSPSSVESRDELQEVGSPKTVAALEELLDMSIFLPSPSEESSSPVLFNSSSDLGEQSLSPSSPSCVELSSVSPRSEIEDDTAVTAAGTPIRKALKRSEDRIKPYLKSSKKAKSEEQKSRKRQQNRDAALRYRSKKKDELGVLTAQAEELEANNKDLRDKVLTVSKEIEYLKNLMLDVIKARLGRVDSLELVR